MKEKLRKFFKTLGPGLITGAADDDPSGIATYSVAGAQFGNNLLWVAWLTFPLMTAVQEICARIGLVTKTGLAGVIKANYPRPLLFLVSFLLLFANIFNIGADISGMAAAIRLLLPVNELILGFVVAVILVIVMICLPYRKIASIFKWLTLVLFAYIITFFIIKPDYAAILKQTFLPDFSLFKNPVYLLTLVGVLGTTISPYLFFWQASEEVEEQKINHRVVTKNELKIEQKDTTVGMFFSNITTFFIIATTSATLFKAGITNISSASDAALALRPLAGDLSFLLFALGIIGVGVLGIPVLAGSAAYVVAETFGFTEGLNKSFHRAKAFYGVIAIATILGFFLNLLGLNPIQYLLYAAVLNGIVAPILIAVILFVANNKKIMGIYTNNRLTNLLAVIALVLMSVSALAMFFALKLS